MGETNEEQGRVIQFPTWRRALQGAPGTDTEREVDDEFEGGPAIDGREAIDGHGAPQSAAALGDMGPMAASDRPVWHEGASVTGDALIRVRIDVLGVRPPIWRRLEIRGSLTLDLVHPVLAAAFGWPRDAEYRFRDVLRDDRSTRVGITFGNPWTDRHLAYSTRPPEWSVPLNRVLIGPRARMRYDYGRRFGFACTVVAEDVIPAPAAAGPVPDARCLAGRRAAPPSHFQTSDSYELALAAPASVALLWEGMGDMALPEGYDPEAFDLDLADRRVRAAVED